VNFVINWHKDNDFREIKTEENRFWKVKQKRFTAQAFPGGSK
jgi:hypothetical protein